MFQEFEGTEQQIELVRRLSIEAYDYFGRKFIRENLPRQDLCEPVTHRLVHQLRDLGYQAKYRLYRNSEAAHVHLGLGNDWVADAQWLQFLGRTDNPQEIERRKSLPDVVIAQLDAIPSLLKNYGVAEEDLAFWTNAHELED